MAKLMAIDCVMNRGFLFYEKKCFWTWLQLFADFGQLYDNQGILPPSGKLYPLKFDYVMP